MPAMPTTLGQLIDAVKAESRLSLNAAHGTQFRDTLVYTIQRVQKQLYMAHDWPYLRTRRLIVLVPGETLYDYPEDMSFEAAADVYASEDTRWRRLDYGLKPTDFASLGTLDNTARGYPPRRWQHMPDGTHRMEVWPVPDQDGQLCVVGTKALGKLVDASDTATLDGTLIALYAAAEILADNKSDTAPMKLEQAKQYFRLLRARMGANKNRPFVIGGAGVD